MIIIVLVFFMSHGKNGKNGNYYFAPCKAFLSFLSFLWDFYSLHSNFFPKTSHVIYTKLLFHCSLIPSNWLFANILFGIVLIIAIWLLTIQRSVIVTAFHYGCLGYCIKKESCENEARFRFPTGLLYLLYIYIGLSILF